MASSWCRLTDRAYAAGDPPAGARPWDEVRAPPGAQHSASLRAITARQLQALVRQPGLYDGTQPSPPHSHTMLSGTATRLPDPSQEGQTRAPESRTGARPEMLGKRLLPTARAAWTMRRS